jgi:hypothetical protein
VCGRTQGKNIVLKTTQQLALSAWQASGNYHDANKFMSVELQTKDEVQGHTHLDNLDRQVIGSMYVIQSEIHREVGEEHSGQHFLTKATTIAWSSTQEALF